MKGFRVSISFSSALIFVISCLLLDFEFFFDLAPLALLFWRQGVNFRFLHSSHMGTYCYIFSSRECLKCVPEILVCCVHSCWLNFFISAFISLFIQSTFKSQLFSFHEAVQFWVSFWILSSNLVALWSERLLWFQLFCICWAVLYFQLCGQF